MNASPLQSALDAALRNDPGAIELPAYESRRPS
jgi:hypothetical protein